MAMLQNKPPVHGGAAPVTVTGISKSSRLWSAAGSRIEAEYEQAAQQLPLLQTDLAIDGPKYGLILQQRACVRAVHRSARLCALRCVPLVVIRLPSGVVDTNTFLHTLIVDRARALITPSSPDSIQCMQAWVSCRPGCPPRIRVRVYARACVAAARSHVSHTDGCLARGMVDHGFLCLLYTSPSPRDRG